MEGMTTPLPEQGAPRQLAGRSPIDYWQVLSNGMQRKVYARIYNHFRKQVFRNQIAMRVRWAPTDIISECTSDACCRLLSYQNQLNLAPEPLPGALPLEWYQKSQDALVAFACGMTIPVIADFYRKNASQLQAPEEEADAIEDPNSNIESAADENEKAHLLSGFIGELRNRLLARKKTAVVCVLDQLTRNAESKTSAVQFSRGEIQIDNERYSNR